jgi:hypothetical protein
VATSVAQTQICKGVPAPSRSAQIIRIVIIASAITLPILVLRVFSRIMITDIWWDDWIILAATVHPHIQASVNITNKSNRYSLSL